MIDPARNSGTSLFAVAALCGAALAAPLPSDPYSQLTADGPWTPGAVRELSRSGQQPGAHLGLFVERTERASARRGRLVGLARVDDDGVARWSVALPTELAGSALTFQAWRVGATKPSGSLAVGIALAEADFTLTFEGTVLGEGEQYDPPDGVPILALGYSIGPGPLNGFNDVHLGNAVPTWAHNRTTVLAGHDDIVLQRIDGGTFSLMSFDLAGFPTGNEVPFTVTSSSGGLAHLAPDGFVDGAGGGEDFETFTLPAAGFTNVDRVSFFHSGPGTFAGTFHLDNLVLRPGPLGGMENLAGAGGFGAASTATTGSGGSSAEDPALP